MDLLQQIEYELPKMSKGHKLLANYVLENYDKAAYMTAQKIGKEIGISESTVVRFAYSLGFEGYPQFQRALKQLVQSKLTSLQRLRLSQSEMNDNNVVEAILKEDINNIKATLENMDKEVFNKAVQAVLNADKVYIIGVRSCEALSAFLIHYLAYLLPDSLCVMPAHADTPEYIVRINPNDCLIGISFPRYSNKTVDAMKYAKEQGAKTIAITDTQMSPLAKEAEYCLFAKSHTTALADSLVAPLSIINAFVAAISLHKQDEVKEYFEALEEVWGNSMVYSKKAEQ